MGILVVSKVPVAQLGPPMYSISQGIQLELQSGRTRPDRPCSLYHASMPEQIKATTTVCKHILCEKQSASYFGIDA